MKNSMGIGRSVLAISVLLTAAFVEAGFQSTETYLVAVGRAPGAFGAQIYSTVWATNLTGAPNSFTIYFLKQGQANTSPASFSDSLAPGETKIYENIVESKFHLTSVIGAARIVSAGEILVSERIYNQPSGADLGNTEGFFFAGVPKSFSISSGQSASIQGINQGGSENFRSNFILVETGGAGATVNVQVFDNNGHQLGQKAYPLQPYEQLQGNVGDIVPSIATTNGRITATVTEGTGSALLAGAQIANESQDSSGFEMSFRDDLLGGNSSGGGLTAVAHDGTLLGNGTATTPLGVNPGSVVTALNGVHGGVTLSAGSNVTITPSGSTLTIASTGGGGGGLTLPFTGGTTDPSYAMQITNQNTSGASLEGILGNPSGFSIRTAAVLGSSATKPGVMGQSDDNFGVLGESMNGIGVYGETGTTTAVAGQSGTGIGVVALSSGTGLGSPALRALANGSGIAVYATNNSTDSTLVLGNSNSGGDLIKGFGGGAFSPQFEVSSVGAVTALSFNGNSNDFADRLPSQTGLAPGDVVAIGSDGKLLLTTRSNQADVAGVYSTQPAMIAGLEKRGTAQVPLAVAGVIPVRVTTENGRIRPGDLLVSSSTPGHAMRAPEMPTPGTVIGKAMQALESGNGTIEMLVMLR